MFSQILNFTRRWRHCWHGSSASALLDGERGAVVVVDLDGEAVAADGRIRRQVSAVDPVAGSQVRVWKSIIK